MKNTTSWYCVAMQDAIGQKNNNNNNNKTTS